MFLINILKICAYKIMLIAGNELATPILINKTLNHLFNKVLNYKISRRKAIINKIIN